MNKDIDWAIKQHAPHTCKHVLFVLANRADKNHQCFPSLARIASDTGMTRRSAIRCINTLEELGLIQRQNRGIDSTIYTLKVGTERHHSAKKKQQGGVVTGSHHQEGHTVPSDTPSLVTESHQGSDKDDTKVVTQSHTEPKEETKVNPKVLPPAPKTPSERPRDLAADLFTDAYRQHIQSPYGFAGGDFPQLMKLRKRLGIGNLETPNEWGEAILNYFATPFAEYSLQHLASKFDTFKNSALDRYKVPTNHTNGGNGNGTHRQTDHQKNNAVLQDFLDRNMAPEEFGDVPHVRKDPK